MTKHVAFAAVSDTGGHDELTIGTLARAALVECDGDVDRAIAVVTERLLSDVVLLRVLIEPAVRSAASTNVQGAVRAERASIIRRAANRPALNGAAIMQTLRSNLLDFPLAGGLRLRDATRADVLAQVDRYASQASDLSHKAAWLRAIADATKGRKRVGECVTAEQAQKLFDEAGR